MVSFLVEAFISMTHALVMPKCTLNCWLNPQAHIPQQKDEGPLAHVITYLYKIAICQPLCTVWNQFAWPLPPSTLLQDKPPTFIQGHVIDLEKRMPPLSFHINSEVGKFLGFAWGLLFEGTILTYNPTIKNAEWIPMHSSVSDLTHFE